MPENDEKTVAEIGEMLRQRLKAKEELPEEQKPRGKFSLTIYPPQVVLDNLKTIFQHPCSEIDFFRVIALFVRMEPNFPNQIDAKTLLAMSNITPWKLFYILKRLHEMGILRKLSPTSDDFDITGKLYELTECKITVVIEGFTEEEKSSILVYTSLTDDEKSAKS